MAGLSDIRHELCLWLRCGTGPIPILKERMFGLTGPQGNHGEDVKDYWWYLDALPSHAWLRWRYHYPQAAFPYQRLIEENARRSRDEPEFELLDTGVFDDGPVLGRWMSRTRRRRRQKCSPGSRSRTGPRTRRRCRCSRRLVPQQLAVRRRRVPELRQDGNSIAVDHARLAGYRLLAGPDPTASSPKRCSVTTRRTPPGCSGPRRSPPTPRTGSTTTSSAAPTR